MRHFKTLFFLQRFALWRAVVFFGLLLIAIGCKKDQPIGVEIQPEGYLDSIQSIDTLTVVSRTILSDAQRSIRFQNFVGQLSNEAFGRAEAIFYVNFGLESENIFLDLPGPSYTVDSLVFAMKPANAYGVVTEPLTIEAYQIEDPMDIDSVYVSNRHFRLDDQPAGALTWSYESNDQVSEDFVSASVRPFRMHLRKDLGEHLLQGIGSQYSSSEAFRNYFGGLALKMKDPGPDATGAIFNMGILGDGYGLTLYYHYIDAAGDTVPQQLSYETGSTTMRYNEFVHDHSGSLSADALAGDDDLLFVQGMSGVKGEITIPYLNAFAQKVDIALSRATLTFTGADEQPEDLARSAILYLLDYEIDPTTGERIETLTSDYSFSVTRHGGDYDEATNSYAFDITRQVQHVISSAKKGEDVNLGYTLNAQVPVLNGNVRTQNVLKGSNNIVLKLYYTDISD